jgi:glutamine synthetase
MTGMAVDVRDISIGQLGFIDRHNLWSDAQKAAAERLATDVQKSDLQVIRISFGDQHGILKGKTLLKDSFLRALRNGQDFTVAPLVFDTANGIAFNPFIPGGGFGMSEMSGFPDAILVPDPVTFRVLPWAPRTGWVLADMYFSDGKPVPFVPRNVMKAALGELHGKGFEYLSGLEVEWYITKLEDPMLRPEQQGGPGTPADPPQISAIAHGYQYLDEWHNDQIDPILQVLRQHLVDIGLPLRTTEDEWGPGQVEFTFHALPGIESADAMLLFRSAAKQICRRLGYHATFMCKPIWPSFFSSGWHLHQCLLRADVGDNAFAPPPGPNSTPLSDVGKHFVGGLLEHAAAASVFTTPTINGYKRRKPYSLAPDRATWGYDNRAAMIRVQGGGGDATTHVENRVGESAANPYLYMASQIYAGLDGLERKLDPGPLSETPYEEKQRPLLPKTLMEAVEALKTDSLYRSKMGDAFIDYIVNLKEFEIKRFLEAEPDWEKDPEQVTNWEHREYFETF